MLSLILWGAVGTIRTVPFEKLVEEIISEL